MELRRSHVWIKKSPVKGQLSPSQYKCHYREGVWFYDKILPDKTHPDKIPLDKIPLGQNPPGQNPPIIFYIQYPLPPNSKHFLSESVHYFIRILKQWGIETFIACPWFFIFHANNERSKSTLVIRHFLLILGKVNTGFIWQWILTILTKFDGGYFSRFYQSLIKGCTNQCTDLKKVSRICFPDMSQLRLYRLSTLSLLTYSLTTVNKIYYCQ